MVNLDTQSPCFTEERPQSSSYREPEDGLAPVALTGGLVGRVVDRCGLPIPARVLLRDRTGAVIRECFTASPRAASAGGRFQMGGLPTGAYVVEINAPGFAPVLRHGVRVEAPCVTELGAVRMMRADSPSITAHPPGSEAPRLLPVATLMR